MLNEVAEFQVGKPHTWFRGQNKECYKLNSGIYRNELKLESSIISTERAYYEVFKRLGHIHLDKEDDWNLLFLMQHHGVKTRLLDWTESFATALFFATDNWYSDDDKAIVWMLDPLQLNNLTLKEEVFYMPEHDYEKYIDLKGNVKFNPNTLALYPVRNSSRIVSQQGMFTLQGNINLPIEEEFESSLIDKGILKRITLDHKLKKDIKMYLKQGGISDFSLFPDLDGLAKYVNKLGFFKVRDTQEIN